MFNYEMSAKAFIEKKIPKMLRLLLKQHIKEKPSREPGIGSSEGLFHIRHLAGVTS